SRDPELAEVTLAVAPVPVGVLHGVEHLLLGLAVEPGALPAVAARTLQDGTALLVGVDRPLDACHVESPSFPAATPRAGAAGGGGGSAAQQPVHSLGVHAGQLGRA